MFTFDNASKALKLYINGSQFSTTRTLTGSLPIDDGTLYLGTYNGTATNYSFLGYLDEVRTYTSALSAGGVTNLYQSSSKANVNAIENSDLTNGLVGLWSFNGADVSGTTAYDRSGNGNNATLNGSPSITQGKVGQALAFHEGGDYVKANGYSTSLTQGIVSLWVKFEGNLSESQYHFAMSSHELGGRDDIELWYDGYSSRFIFTLAADWATEFSVATPAMTSANELHQWHHLVGVWDKDVGTKIYFDGIFQGANGTTFNSLTALRWSIGGYPSAYKSWLGSIDEARAYNRVLTATEIWNLYQAGGGTRVNSADSQGDALERGLSGYWKLDDGSGTSATDASTKGNNGTLTNGPTWATGQVGGATTFDGSNDYITIPNSNDFAYNQDFSVSVWAKIPATQNDTAAVDNSLIEKWSNAGGYPYVIRLRNQTWGTVPERGTVAFARYDGTNAPSISSSITVNDNVWHLITATKQGSTLAFYVDGVRQGSTTDTTTGTTTNASPICLGMRCSTAKYLTGSLDEVRIYNHGLSPSEVAKLYKTTAPDNPDSGLKGYWSFNGPDVSGTTAYDLSGQGNNGTLTSGPTPIIGKVGQGMNFNGTGQYMSIPDPVSGVLDFGTGSFSVSVWGFHRDFTYPRTTFAFQKSNQCYVGGRPGWDIGHTYSADGIDVCLNDGTNVVRSATTLDIGSRPTDFINRWIHAIIVFDRSAGRTKYYINGVKQVNEQDISTVTGSIDNTAGLLMGNLYGWTVDGIHDEVRIYNRALSATEVTNLYNLGR